MLAIIHSFFPYDCAYHLNPQTKKSPFADLRNLDDLALRLTIQNGDLNQWLLWKEDIKEFIQAHGEDLTKVDAFLKTLTAWGMERDPQKTMAILVDIVSLELLNKVIVWRERNSVVPFKDVFEWAAYHRDCLPEPVDRSFKMRISSEWKKCRPIVLHMIPNLINIFLGAFNFLDAHKKFTTLWEKHLLLEIIYKFFIIPYCLIKILQPVFVVTAKVYLVSALVIVGTGILVSCYQRWFRPLPNQIVNCSNLDEQMEKGLIAPKVGQEKELNELMEALDRDIEPHALLIGNSGDGKTALLHHFIQRKREGKVPDKLKNVTVFEVDCGLIVSSYSYGHSEVINQIKEQTEGYNGDILFFFDEFCSIATNAAAFQAFKKRFLDDQPHTKFVAAITFKEWEQIATLDKDGSFLRRVTPIMVPSIDKENLSEEKERLEKQNRMMIRNIVNRVAKDIPFSDEAITAISEISAKEDYLPGIGRPAKAIKILMDAIALCRSAYHPHYISNELIEARQKYQELQLQVIQKVKPDPNVLKSMCDLRTRIAEIEKKLNDNKRQAGKIKKIYSERQEFNEIYYNFSRLLASATPPLDLNSLESKGHQTKSVISKESISQNVQISYLWYYFYGIEAMEKILQNEIDKIRKDMPVQVDKNLIDQIYKKSKVIGKQFAENVKHEQGTAQAKELNQKGTDQEISKEKEKKDKVDEKNIKRESEISKDAILILNDSEKNESVASDKK
jgi:hypothetical protein